MDSQVQIQLIPMMQITMHSNAIHNVLQHDVNNFFCMSLTLPHNQVSFHLSLVPRTAHNSILKTEKLIHVLMLPQVQSSHIHSFSILH